MFARIFPAVQNARPFAAVVRGGLALSIIVFGLAPAAQKVAAQSRLGEFAARELQKEREERKETAPKGPKDQATRRKREAASSAPRRWRRAPISLEAMVACGVSGVEVFLDGRSAGTTDQKGELKFAVESGSHAIFLRRPGFLHQRRTVTIRPNQTAFAFMMKPLARGESVEGLAWSLPLDTDRPYGVDEAMAEFLAEQNREKALAELIDRMLAKSAASGGESVPALNEWQRALGAPTPLDEGGTKASERVLFARAYVAYLQRNHADAIGLFNSILETAPQSALAFYGLGHVYLATNQRAEALRAYNRAVQADAGFAPAYRALGDAARSQGKNSQALEHYRDAVEHGDKDSATRLNIARILAEKRNWSQALKELGQLPAEQRTAEVLLLTGDCYAGDRQWPKALESYRLALELDRDSAAAYYKLGEALLERRDYRQAHDALERSLVLDQSGAAINRAEARKMADEAARRSFSRSFASGQR